MEFRLVNSEEPHLHWESVFVKGKRVLDLGCGDFGRIAGLTYPSTLEYFLGLGAIYVIGVDGSNQDVETMKSNMNDYLDMFSIENTLISNVDTMN